MATLQNIVTSDAPELIAWRGPIRGADYLCAAERTTDRMLFLRSLPAIVAFQAECIDFGARDRLDLIDISLMTMHAARAGPMRIICAGDWSRCCWLHSHWPSRRCCLRAYRLRDNKYSGKQRGR